MSSIEDRIRAEIEGHPVVLFMKGTPQFPMCGFSSRAVQALKAAGAAQLHTVNVLEEPEIRANLPRFSNWPTKPTRLGGRTPSVLHSWREVMPGLRPTSDSTEKSTMRSA